MPETNGDGRRFEGYVTAKLEENETQHKQVVMYLQRIEKKLDEQNGRVRRNEGRIAWIMGVGAVVVWLIPVLIRVLWQ